MVIATARSVVVSLALSLCCVTSTAEANLLWAVGEKVASLLLSEGIDRLWDKATGKPDVRAVNERLMAVERVVEGADPAAARIVRGLRTRVTPATTRDEYQAMAADTFTALSRRIAELERGVQRNTQALEQLNSRLSDVERRVGAGQTAFPSTGRIDPRPSPLDRPSGAANPLIGAWLGRYVHVLEGVLVQEVLRFNPDGSIVYIAQVPDGRQAAGIGRYEFAQNEVHIQAPNFSSRALLTWSGPNLFRYLIVQHTVPPAVGQEIVFQRLPW